MRGLDWSNTSYARLYRQDTAAWKRLKWEAQAVYVLLVRHLDRAGCLELDGLFAFEAVAEMTGISEEVCELAVPRLEAAGFIVVNGDKLTDPEFLEREEATMSNAQRKREYRERRRSEALLGSRCVANEERSVALSERTVTEKERGGTRRNAEERGGTPSVPSVLEGNKTCASGDARVVDAKPTVAKKSKAEIGFDVWWPLMPSAAKKGRAKAVKAWRALTAERRDPDPVAAFLDFLRETEAEVYVKDGGQYLPHGAAFVNARLWEDDREAFQPMRSREASRPRRRLPVSSPERLRIPSKPTPLPPMDLPLFED